MCILVIFPVQNPLSIFFPFGIKLYVKHYSTVADFILYQSIAGKFLYLMEAGVSTQLIIPVLSFNNIIVDLSPDFHLPALITYALF